MNIFAVAMLAALAIRIVMHFVDKSRIRHEIESKSGRVVAIKWNPFGRGWFFERGERHYQVNYIDPSGATISTGCKTSLFTGIYWSEGPRVEDAAPRIAARHRCSGCGYALNVEWRACPNCGKATQFV